MSGDVFAAETLDERALERALSALAVANDTSLAVEERSDGWEAEFRVQVEVLGGAHDGIALIGADGATRRDALLNLYLLVGPAHPAPE